MGDASRAEFSSGYVSWRKAKDSIGLDVAQLLKEKPYLQAKYPLLKPRVCRILCNRGWGYCCGSRSS